MLAQSQDGERVHGASGEDRQGSHRQFSSCGVGGSMGPAQEDCDQAYGGTRLHGTVEVDGGYQLWTVSASGVYAIEAAGGNGGMMPPRGVPGKGAKVDAAFRLNKGDQLVVLVGQRGHDAFEACAEGGAGGGGGTFIGLLGRGTDTFAKSAPKMLAGKKVTLLLAAGGGAGNDDNGWASCAQTYPQGMDGKAELHGGQQGAHQPARRDCDARGAGFAKGSATRTFLAGFGAAAFSKGWRNQNQGGFGGGANGCSAGGGGGGYYGGDSPEQFGGHWSGVQGGTSYVHQDPSIFVEDTAVASSEKNENEDGSGRVSIHGPSHWTHTQVASGLPL
jgi:hypothetical protein